jgi:hypothetical protein
MEQPAAVLQGFKPRTGRPWRLERTFWAVPFGLGAVSVLLWQVGSRFGLAPRRRHDLALATALAIAGVLGLSSLSQQGFTVAVLIWERPAALLLYFVGKRLLRVPDRGYHYYAGGELAYGRFIRAAMRGLVVVGLVEAVLILLAVLQVAP